MQVIVPAAGKGTRLRPVTDEKPKGLVSILDRPLLAYVFDQLEMLPVDEVIVIVGYKGEQIISHFGEHVGELSLRYVWQEEQRGLAHAIAQARHVVTDDVLVVNGDNVFCDSIEPILTPDADGAVLVEDVTREQAKQTGVVTVTDGFVDAIVEKPANPPTTLATTGAYLLPHAAMDICHTLQPASTGETEVAQVISALLESGYRFRAVPYAGWRQNVNTVDDVALVEERLAGRL